MFSKVLIDRLKSARHVCVLTGAGISAESGVPTFRGENGIWKRYSPEELANFDAFLRNPELVWEWYGWRRSLISEVEPNPAHYALAEMEKQIEDFWLVTQNVDGLHWRAGNSRILELHGNIMRSLCLECGKHSDEAHMESRVSLPHCECGGLMRPDVVWFGEMLPEAILSKAVRVSEDCEVFLSIGTSAVIQPAASLPLMAKRHGAFVIEINRERTVISGEMDEVILGEAGSVLPALLKSQA